MRVLLISRINEHSQKFAGVFNKIKGQLEGFEQAGCEVFCLYMSYGTQTLAKYHDNHFVAESLAFTNINAKDEPVTFWENAVSVVNHVQPDFIYVRYEPMLHSPTLVRFFEQVGLQSAAQKCIEFPTYPYESELPDANLDTVRTNRRAMLEHVDHVFSTCYEPLIMGRVNHPFDNQLSESMINRFAEHRLVPSRKQSAGINLLIVANLSRWHGVDRVLFGLKEYYNQPRDIKVTLHIVGVGEMLEKLKSISNDLGINHSVVFHGFKSGEELSQLFIDADVAIASLGMHRTGLYRSSTLKAREYMASGLPVIYCCDDSLFEDNPYAMKVAEDDTALNISDVIRFSEALTEIDISKADIAAFASGRISWRTVACNVLSVVKGSNKVKITDVKSAEKEDRNDSWLTSFRQLWKDKTYIAFVGTGRIGTNFFASFFDSVLDEGISVHEPRPDAFDLAMDFIRNKPDVSEAAQEYVRIRSELFSRMTLENKRYFIESNNNLSLLLPVIELLFPNYKVVHVIRHPEDYICSVLGNVQARGYSAYSDNDPRQRLAATDFNDDVFCKNWRNFSQEEKIAWYWGKYNDEINQQMKGKPQYLQLRFADLFESGSFKSMRHMLQFLQIEPLMQLDDSLLEQQFRTPRNMSKKKVASFASWPESMQHKCRVIFNSFKNCQRLSGVSDQ